MSTGRSVEPVGMEPPPSAPASGLGDVALRLQALLDRIVAAEAGLEAELARVAPDRLASARNLIHYVALRQVDLRPLQDDLLRRGLSSLGRCEANVHATLDALLEILGRLAPDTVTPSSRPVEVGFDRGRELLDRSTVDLFGQRPVHGGAHIMVTMPSEAADDHALVSDLLAQGMDCMRVNCAHDDAIAWTRMIESLRRAEAEQGRACRVLMDLPGPKLRTGPLEPGPAVRKWRPRRDSSGRLLAPARIWIHAEGRATTPPLPADASLPVGGPLPADLALGEELVLEDAGGRKRHLRLVEAGHGGWWAECSKTAYVTPGTPLHRGASNGKRGRVFARVGSLPPTEQFLTLRRGDVLLLGDDCKLGSPARYDEHGSIVRPATIGCTLPEVFGFLKRGERVLFDDGKIGAVVREVHARHAVLDVVTAGAKGTKLRADKGINLPDSDVRLDALTPQDLDDLSFAVEHADMVGMSFVRRTADVERLHEELARRGRPDMPIVLKIENRQAFEGLPSLLLAAMRSPTSGVMIARGDLAVEIGWQRLAEVQEEILWMCEAAHMPVVWATQVLETLAKTGTPSRAEITDAAMGVRAECVMLNKGPHVVEAVRVLGDILRRMKDHQVKKRPLLRRLHLADGLRGAPEAKHPS
ncbi:MAG: pyruvate kinase [Planctomycetota bacterium]